MAVSEATVTLDLADMLGTDFDPRRTKVWVTTNIANDTLIDTDGNKIRLGSGNVTIAADGTASLTVWVPGVDTNPASWQTSIHVGYPDRNTHKGRGLRTFGPYTITTSADLADLEDEQAVPPEYLTTVTTQLEAIRDEAQAARDLAVDISNIDDTDSAVAAGFQIPGSQSGAYLSATIAGAIAGLKYRTDAAGETIQSRLETGSDNIVLTVLGDSTGNDTHEWVRLSEQAIGAAHPALHVESSIWNGSAYPAATIVQAGTGYTPAGPQTVLDDTFTRTDSNLIGDSPDIGPVWSGTSGANNAWRTDGSKMVRDGAVTSSAGVSSQLGEYADMTATFDNITLSTVGDTVNREFNVYFRASNNGADGIRLRVQIAATTGTVSWHLFKLVASASTTLAIGSANPIPAATASNTFDLTIETSGRDITVTLNGVTLNHTLSEADHAAITGTDFIINSSAGTLVGMSIDRVTVAMEAVASGQALTVWNGSQAGATLAYQTTNLATMLPADTDVVVISSSHNYGGDDTATYISAVETFIDAVQAQAPNTKVILSSQNPEFVGTFGATEVAAHLRRLTALRVLAVANGYGYVPVLEAFLSQPDRGQSLVKADGIHPTTATDNPTVNGSLLWRDTFMAYLRAHALVDAA